ncbi:hypothetical protein ABPG75_005731 [Micractinium tetrahymenae]
MAQRGQASCSAAQPAANRCSQCAGCDGDGLCDHSTCSCIIPTDLQVNPDCCSQNCEPSSRKCCRPNAISAANLKLCNASILGPDDQCQSETECCFHHCVPIDGKQACLPCVPAAYGNCVEDGDCCFGSKCNKATKKCCIGQGTTCNPQVGSMPSGGHSVARVPAMQSRRPAPAASLWARTAACLAPNAAPARCARPGAAASPAARRASRALRIVVQAYAQLAFCP